MISGVCIESRLSCAFDAVFLSFPSFAGTLSVFDACAEYNPP